MKKTLLFTVICLLLLSFASATIIINTDAAELYNSGDMIKLPAKIVADDKIEEFLTGELICNGNTNEVYKEFISLLPGEEKQIGPTIPLTKSTMGQTYGNCIVKLIMNEDYQITNEFQVSNLINLEISGIAESYSPGEEITISGNAIKANGEPSEGIVELKIITEGESKVTYEDSVNGGYFEITATIPADFAAGQYLLTTEVYEKEVEEITNRGFVNINIQINQIPTSLELITGTSEVIPGTNAQVKAILHDQTGEKIESVAEIILKTSEGKTLKQEQVTTDTFLEYPTEFSQPAIELIAVATSNGLEATINLRVIEYSAISLELVNNTLIVSNEGNIPYNDIVTAKIGAEEMQFNTTLKVGQTKTYLLTAPDGTYQIEIISDGETQAAGEVLLTGKAISVQETKEGVVKIVSHPISWIFMIMIMGFVAFMLFKKGYKRSFVGYVSGKMKKKPLESTPLKKDSLINSSSPAQVSLSIQGSKQNASIISLHVKNLNEIQTKKGNAQETLQKIVDKAEERKVATYENQDHILFILSPIKTKTFANEKPAIEVAQEIKKQLEHHNKLSPQKIAYGIGINYGTIVSKQEKEKLLFMSMGTFVSAAKKVASISKSGVFLSEAFRNKVLTQTKTKKHTHGSINYFSLEEVKKHKEENKKFIRDFVQKLEGEKEKKKK